MNSISVINPQKISGSLIIKFPGHYIETEGILLLISRLSGISY